jgi:hypothetical protein
MYSFFLNLLHISYLCFILFFKKKKNKLQYKTFVMISIYKKTA